MIASNVQMLDKQNARSPSAFEEILYHRIIASLFVSFLFAKGVVIVNCLRRRYDRTFNDISIFTTEYSNNEDFDNGSLLF